MTTLNDYFRKNNIKITEGNIGGISEQQNEIIEILKNNTNISKIMEIGFNAGHSAELFLENSNAYVYSFDIGTHFHQYLKYGKVYINNKFPNRHTLVFGDSMETIPRFKSKNDIKFDVIFIDGGHDYDIAYADLINCRELAHSETIVIMDDIVKNPSYHAGYTIGPTNAWNDLVNSNMLLEISHTDYSFGRGQSVGKYLYDN
jgi:predicted O-methyltransferase YrrM